MKGALSVQALDKPSGRVVLVVSGAINEINVGDEAHFDRDMLQALPQHQSTTHTPWHDGGVDFRGPLGRTLLGAVGAQGIHMRVTALNEYSAVVPVSDFMKHDVVLALSANGKMLRVRDQGPLFIIYPFDDEPELLNEVVLSRSVWQVKRIDIE